MRISLCFLRLRSPAPAPHTPGITLAWCTPLARHRLRYETLISCGFWPVVWSAAKESRLELRDYLMYLQSGEISPPSPACAVVELVLLSASHTCAHSWLGLRKTSLAPPARDRVGSVLCTLASVLALNFASSVMCLLREILPALHRFACAFCVRLFGASPLDSLSEGAPSFSAVVSPSGASPPPYGPTVWGSRPWTPSQRELHLLGRGLPLGGFSTPLAVQPSGAVAPGLPLRGSSIFLGRGLPPGGFSTPLRSNRLGQSPLDFLSEGAPSFQPSGAVAPGFPL
jgi:hypothetical protein